MSAARGPHSTTKVAPKYRHLGKVECIKKQNARRMLVLAGLWVRALAARPPPPVNTTPSMEAKGGMEPTLASPNR